MSIQRSAQIFTCFSVSLLETGAMIMNEQMRISLLRLEQVHNQSFSETENGGQITFLETLQSVSVAGSFSLNNNMRSAYMYFRKNFKLIFEHERQSAFSWFKSSTESKFEVGNLAKIKSRDELRYEQDHLITMRGNSSKGNLTLVINQIIHFACKMQPNNISEFVSYMEFVICYENTRLDIVKNLDKPVGNQKLVISKFFLLFS
jgi:hypothetical protein